MINNKIYTHPNQPQMQVEVILASKGPYQKPIYTIRLRYPRIIHGEIMTHRMFSRNARSSRAVPVRTMLKECTEIPFIPWYWGKNQKGMQADEECNSVIDISIPEINSDTYELEYQDKTPTREEAWLYARDIAVEVAEGFMDSGYHKQIPNRLLEPFSWMDTLITSTEWDNFLWLRDHKDAEPHLQDLARLVKQAINETKPKLINQYDWHQPYVTQKDRETIADYIQNLNTKDNLSTFLNKISAARCARISYKPFDGDASYEREFERYNSLVTSDRVHASPLEHQAQPDTKAPTPHGISNDYNRNWMNEHLHGNLEGYIQYRKTIPNECYTATQ